MLCGTWTWRAHAHRVITRKVFVRLLEEDPRSQEEDICGVLSMALHGTRDAGQNFELTVTTAVTEASCVEGRGLQPVRALRESAWHVLQTSW